ncbi:hypothetical protein HanHA300_Chr13g0484361 [Helianthus annuus]|nr:hypothetical protein HanHA300_Chr13g0484361 [Helianthus annuus]KAJ0497902.1 hypothetical protein HanHA89_Chr13g0516331 [Helianthus annuus]KAJ0663909.1 hypothetical protein HanLR1_Chr13g0486231 [Helianthus annuus]
MPCPHKGYSFVWSDEWFAAKKGHEVLVVRAKEKKRRRRPIVGGTKAHFGFVWERSGGKALYGACVSCGKGEKAPCLRVGLKTFSCWALKATSAFGQMVSRVRLGPVSRICSPLYITLIYNICMHRELYIVL